MDSRFKVPGTRWKFGLDPIMGLFPFFGDSISYILSGILIVAMVRHGASGKLAAKMLLNITLDFLIGSIPVLGNIFDFAYKANTRNLHLLEEYHQQGQHRGSAWSVILPVIAGVFFVVFAIIFLALFLMAQLFGQLFAM